MIPENLQSELIKRFKKVFKGDLFNGSNGERVPVKVYEQHLPIPKRNENPHDEFAEEDDSSSNYPAIIVQLFEGIQEQWDSKQIVTVNIIVGVHDDSESRAGYKDVTAILRKIHMDLAKNRQMKKQYSLPVPPRWKIHDEDTHPYYFGAMLLEFEEAIQILDEEVNKLI